MKDRDELFSNSMRNRAIHELMRRYARVAEERIKSRDYRKGGWNHLDHLSDMAVLACPDTFSSDKMQRWLGFMQGVLWSEDVYGLQELKEHVREVQDEDQRNRQKTDSKGDQGSVLEVRSL